MQTTIQQPTTVTVKKPSWAESRAEKKAAKLAAKIAKASASPQVQVAAVQPTSFYELALEWTHRADKVINLVLGYLLAIASVLGFMDVLSNGEVLSTVPFMFYIWLGIMGLGVDFQILLVIGRMPDLLGMNITRGQKWGLAIFNIGFLVFLVFMSIIISAVFTEHRDMPISQMLDAAGKVLSTKTPTIADAMNTLKINDILFVYGRAALATLLLVLMAVDRMMERWRMQITAYAQYVSTPASTLSTPVVDTVTPVQPVPVGVQTSDMTSLIQAIQEMNLKTLEAMQEMHNQTLARSSQITVSLIEETVNRLSATLSVTGATEARQIAQGATPEQETGELDAMASLGTSKGVSTTYKESIEALLKSEPGLTNEEIASRIGCTVRTVSRWRPRVTVVEA
jgi:hypothetical protein